MGSDRSIVKKGSIFLNVTIYALSPVNLVEYISSPDAISSIYSGASLLNSNILIDFAFVSIVSIIIVIVGIFLFKKYGNK